MPSLLSLVGKKVIVQLQHPLLAGKSNVLVSPLVGLEESGIWLEGSELAEWGQGKFNRPATKTPIFFVPFSQVIWILDSLDSPYLSEKGFGISEF